MKVGRIGGVSPDGKTVLYDANTQEMISLPLPILERGLDIEQGKDGNWHVSIPLEMYEVSPKTTAETEEAYQARVMKHKLHADSFKEMQQKISFPIRIMSMWQKGFRIPVIRCF